MTTKIFKPVLFMMAMLAIFEQGFAQDKSDSSESYFDSKAFNKSMEKLDLKLGKKLDLTLNNLDKTLNASIKNFDQKLQLDILNNITSNITVDFKDLDNIDVNIKDNDRAFQGELQEKIKTYSKSYSVDGNDKLSIINKYGRVNVNTWNKNEVKVDVQIKADATDNETAQKLIDAITISDSKDGNEVAFKTNFASSSNGSMWNLFNNMNDHHKVEVNYTVYMPSTMALQMSNRYGAVVLPNLSGKVILDNAYGSLTARSLSNAYNELNLRYYEVNVEELTGAELNLSYGSLKLGTVGKLDANVNYAPVDIARLNTSGSLNVRYGGGIKINEISKALKSLDIESKYSSVNINLRGDESFNFDVTVKYNSFNFDENKVKITSKSPSDEERGYRSTKNYKGYVGNSNSSNHITINSTYQSVKLE
jgi:hypothetical protein